MITTCGILLIDPVGKILTCHPTRHHPNQWDIVKGQIDPEEEMVDAMVREFKEETNINLLTICPEIIDYSEQWDVEFVYEHKKKKLHGFVGIMPMTCDVAHFKCESMVTGFKDLPPFPEVDAFAWIDISDYRLLHKSQQAFLRHVYDNTDYLKNCSWEAKEKSYIYG